MQIKNFHSIQQFLWLVTSGYFTKLNTQQNFCIVRSQNYTNTNDDDSKTSQKTGRKLVSPASGLDEIRELLLLVEEHQQEDHQEQFQEPEAGFKKSFSISVL